MATILPVPRRLAFSLLLAGCSLAFPTKESADATDAGSSSSSGGVDGSANDGGGGDSSDGSTGPTPKSCEGLTSQCKGRDCCTTALVNGVRLDVFEVTVGRFKKFAATYVKPNLLPAIDPELPADKNNLVATVSNCEGQNARATWNGADDTLPMNCVSWFVAYAFCAWDGGHLPSEEDMRAAAGPKTYPWGDAIDPDHAVYQTSGPAPVGSKSPFGDGPFGHADVAGNLAEWIAGDPSTTRARGGAFDDQPTMLRNDTASVTIDGKNEHYQVGLRCAR